MSAVEYLPLEYTACYVAALEATTSLDAITAMVSGERVRGQRRFERHNGKQDHCVASDREVFFMVSSFVR